MAKLAMVALAVCAVALILAGPVRDEAANGQGLLQTEERHFPYPNKVKAVAEPPIDPALARLHELAGLPPPVAPAINSPAADDVAVDASPAPAATAIRGSGGNTETETGTEETTGTEGGLFEDDDDASAALSLSSSGPTTTKTEKHAKAAGFGGRKRKRRRKKKKKAAAGNSTSTGVGVGVGVGDDSTSLSPSISPSMGPTNSSSPSPSTTPSQTPTTSVTAAPSISSTESPSPTASVTQTQTPSSSPTQSHSSTPEESSTPSATATATSSHTSAPSQSSSNTITASPSYTPSTSETHSMTFSSSPSFSPSISITPDPSASPSPSSPASTSPDPSISAAPTDSPSTSITPSISEDSLPPVPSRAPSNLPEPMDDANFQPHPMERKMYTEESLVDWDYTSKWGPTNARYKICDTGRMQSPIDLHQFAIAGENEPLLVPQYKAGQMLVRNTGQYLRVINNFGSLMYIADRIYELVYIQVHTPSDHRMSGEEFPVELQFYHRATDDGSLAAVSLLYKLGPKSAFIDRIIESAPQQAKAEVLTTSSFNLGDAFPKDITSFKAGARTSYPYYTYQGSMTTPPCTESVKWYVWAKPNHVSQEQIDALEGMFPQGARRELQPGNDRPVLMKTLF